MLAIQIQTLLQDHILLGQLTMKTQGLHKMDNMHRVYKMDSMYMPNTHSVYKMDNMCMDNMCMDNICMDNMYSMDKMYRMYMHNMDNMCMGNMGNIYKMLQQHPSQLRLLKKYNFYIIIKI